MHEYLFIYLFLLYIDQYQSLALVHTFSNNSEVCKRMILSRVFIDS